MSRGFHVVVLKGRSGEDGRLSWGFRLAGGRGTPLTVVEVDKDGKSSGEDGLLVGDQVLRINDVFCSSVAAAQQLIDSAFRTLTLAVFRVSTDAAHGYPSISDQPHDVSNSPQKKHRHPPGGDEARVDGGSPRVSDGGFRQGDEGRASTRANSDNGVSRTGSRMLDEWRRKANQLLSRTPSAAAAVNPHQVALQQKHHHQHPPYQSNPHLHLQQQQQHVSGSAMTVQHQRQQRRNSLGGDSRERAHSFHEPKGVSQHNRSSAAINNKTTAEMANWSTSGYTRMASPLTANAMSPTKAHGQRSPSECDSRAENIYENVGQQKPQPQMALVAHEKSASLSSCCSSPSVDRMLQNTGGKNLTGEGRVRPAFERERRSLRKLTKDSGYETSPYSESDYANMEWLSDQNSERGLMSPSPTHTHMSSYPPYWDSMSDQEGPYQHYPGPGLQRMSRSQYQSQMEGSYAVRSGHLISSRSKSVVYPESRDSGYVSLASKGSSQSRRLSTGEKWTARSHSEQSRELALGRYSSTDSLSSYSSSNSRHHHPSSKVVSAKSTPSLNQQDGRIEEPPALAPSTSLTGSMSSSRSTPNLDNEAEDAMVSRKFKKASVYEALANKSGLDFAPTIQGRTQWDQKERRDGSFNVQHQRSSSTSSCQPCHSYHYRQTSSQSTASDCTSSSGNSQSGHSRQYSGHSSYSEDEGRVLSPRSEESVSSDVTAFPYHHGRNTGHVSLPTYLPEADPNTLMEEFHGSHWIRSQTDLEHLPPPSPGSPPPPAPPVRDGSSLKYMKYGSDHHEKYPSWPVGQSDGGQRSRSWTEGTNDASKDKAAYLRSKKYSQTSFTQQLKTVVENTEKVVLEDPRFISALQSQYFSHLGTPPAEKRGTMERSASYEFGPFCKPEQQGYQQSSYRDYSVHSPPERDVAPEKQRQQQVPSRNDKTPQPVAANSSSHNTSDTWWSPSQGSDFQYSSDATLVLSQTEDHQETPMLDRLRLESTQWSGDQEPDGGGNAGGAGGRGSITSTTSSQETLKWHGSSSDLSVHSDKNAHHSVETVVHSARVQPPQRHNSESVLYYGADEAAAIARSVSDCKRDSPARQGSYTAGDNSDVAPPLPRKTRQWSDQVQKNNYLNRIQMQVRPVAAGHGTSTTVSASALRAAGLAREEIQPPLNPEFAKPLSVAERIQDLERQARIRGSMSNNINQSNRPCSGAQHQRQKMSNGQSSPHGLGSTPKTVQRQATFSEGSASPIAETRMAYLDPEKKHKVSDPELKAIQKQAVWSFFERQTGLSAHGRSSSKESVQFLSRRMAQSLPRDCMQEFKRLQQMQQNEEKKNHGGGTGPMTALPMKAASKHHRNHENGQASKREHENGQAVRREHQDGGHGRSTKALQPYEQPPAKSSNRHQQRGSKGSRSSTLSSSSSSSSTSSPTTPTGPCSVSSSPTQFIRQPSVCYNTCTQTESNPAAVGQAINGESQDVPEKLSAASLQKEKISRHEGTHPPKLSTPDLPAYEAPPVAVASEDLRMTKDTGTQDPTDRVGVDTEEPLPSLVKTSSTLELRTSEGQTYHSLPCNVPCEQTPTKNVHKNESAALSSTKKHDARHSPPQPSKGISAAEPSPVADSYPASVSAEMESVEDVELRKIEESAKVLRNLLPSGSSGTYTPRTHRRLFLNSDGLRNSPSPSVSCPSLSSRSSTPDLPLPPPPKMTELELPACDEPLPPPPSANEMHHSFIEPKIKSPSPNGTSRGTYLSYRGEQHHSDNSCHQSIIQASKMDKHLSPCTAWEQWHNIRQANTTLVFHSGEMMASKTKLSTGSHPLSEQVPARDSEMDSSVVGNGLGTVYASSGQEKVVEHKLTPASRLKTAGSVESLHSVESSSSATSSISCWQETEQSLPSSSSSLSGSIPTLLTDSQKSTSPVHGQTIGKPICRSPKQSVEDGNQKMTEVMTQTVPCVSKMGRKKRDEELECERLSRDLLSHLSVQDSALCHILVPSPEMKTMADYMEGIFEVGVKERDVTRRCFANSSPSSPPPAMEQIKRKSSEVLLPADSAYFTTSESKAKFLTRYSKNMQQGSTVSLGDVKNGSELSEKKSELVDSITRKLKILRSEQLAIKEEISINDGLGLLVIGRVEQLAKPNEVDKFKLHVEEVEKITSLLLGLSGRLARAQNALMTLSEDANHEEKKSLEAKRNKLCEQHEEAKKLKESIDRRGVQVSNFLHNYLSSEEYADYDHFIKMKAKLLMDSREIDDKIKLGEEQMLALREKLKT